MSKHETIRRYTLIIEKIKRSNYPSKTEIIAYLFNQGLEIADRTLERDIKHIRTEFGLEITYLKSQNGYYIDNDISFNNESFFRFLEIVNTAELLTESLKESNDTLEHILFDNDGGLTGIENLKPLLQAIKEHRKISFVHHNYHNSTNKKFALKPYLLKEYKNRWYVIGIVGNMKEFRTFGIERITNLDLKPTIFQPDNSLDAKAQFDQTIGLSYSQNPVEKVVLSFTPTQGKYVASLPLHSSQKVEVDDENEYRISLHVTPNYELTQLILSHRENAKVLEPKWLVAEMKNVITNMLKKYK